MRLVKLPISERIKRAVEAKHGLRLDNKSAYELLELLRSKGVLMPVSMVQKVENKGQGLRLNPDYVEGLLPLLGGFEGQEYMR